MRPITLFVTFFLATMAVAQQAAVVPGEVLFQLKPGVRAETVEADIRLRLGILPRFSVVKCISEPMRAWHATFEPAHLTLEEALYVLRTTPGVSVAQANHIVATRDIPNDPFFGNQWHHLQSNDRDIDSDLAWDITTGGLTPLGAEIVVCVVEPQGAKWDQVDILPNHWVNEGEIPNNNIDDDLNGYVDDYDGYNVTNGTDNLSTSNHGTQVSSMLGAKGDNSTGITGVNWDVKIMQVQLGSVSEANVIEAYTYPLIMRQLFNETGGVRGAFVVATNSSWGTDNGQPANAPLWCAMYDTLGVHGVISCGATSNSNVNIDVVGDLPTACPSEYMIAVTATNNNDVRTFSGYGQTTIDLGAPGADVYLAGNNNYSNTSGTSFASPCVAGAVALLYSAPCNSLAAITLSDPALAAALVRDYIFNGTDAVSNLTTECVTGGRLNLRNSLDLLLAECSNEACLPPFSVAAAETNQAGEAQFSWNAISGTPSYNLRYRQQGAPDWQEMSNIADNSALVQGLLTCTLYEAQVQSNCEGSQSEWSEPLVFVSQGCCENPQSGVQAQAGGTTASVSWQAVTGVLSYTLTLSDGADEVVYENVTGTSFNFVDLETCSAYTLSISTNCDSGSAPDPLQIMIYTGGCESCDIITYCTVSGGANAEWIEQVVIHDLVNSSESDGGYEDFTDLSTTLQPGNTYPISCTPGFAGFAYSEYFKVWADWNSDGEFATEELVFDPETSTTTTVSGTFTVPATVTPGHIRFRVSMSYFSQFGGGDLPVPCGSIEYGEVEDYCVIVDDEIFVDNKESLALLAFPNPSDGQFTFRSPVSGNLRILDSTGRLVRSMPIRQGVYETISGLESGWYLCSQTDDQGRMHRVRIVVR